MVTPSRLPFRKSLAVVLLTLVLFTLTACTRSSWQLAILDPHTGSRHTIRQSDIGRKLIFINYWAEWCKPCLQEIPELNRFAANHTDSVLFVGINFDKLQDAVLQASVKHVGITYPVLIGNPPITFDLPDISGLPTTIILDNQGNMKKRLLGSQTQKTLEDALKDTLAATMAGGAEPN